MAWGCCWIPLLFAAAALAQATEQAQGLAEITAALSVILNNPSMLRWCASTPKFLMAVLVLLSVGRLLLYARPSSIDTPAQNTVRPSGAMPTHLT